jgi:predicted Zn-dependent protease
MLVRAQPRPLRVVLVKGGTEISALAEDGKAALVEALNLLSMQTELEAGNKLTVEGNYRGMNPRPPPSPP